jgi:hypothetical protein
MDCTSVLAVGACSVAIITAAFDLAFPTSATLKYLGQRCHAAAVAREIYCHGNSFARKSARFILRVGRRTCSIAQNVAVIVLFSASVGMGYLQWYSSFGTSTELKFGAIE